MTWKVGPALACGNTIVVKPSEETPLTATLLGEVMNPASRRRPRALQWERRLRAPRQIGRGRRSTATIKPSSA
jgi:hypothetical protein